MNEFYSDIIKWVGLTDVNNTLATFTKLGVALIISLIIYFIFNKIILAIIRRAVSKTKNRWDDILFDSGFFAKLSQLIPVMVFELLISNIEWEYIWAVHRLTASWVVIAILLALVSFLNGIDRIYLSYEVSKNKPLTVFIQVVKIVLYTIAFISIISILANKEPDKLFVGLGAFAAVVMLIFKDSILGFVAGVQLISNKMVAIGDWIVMPDANADGEVLEINLYTVKVQNWDMTISTIPTYKLVSESFTNWKGMQQSKGRRIKRSINIDIASVHFLTKEELQLLMKSNFLRDYLDTMVNRLGEYENSVEGEHLDTTHLTNIGVFRVYLLAWLRANKNINQQMTLMVRQLQPAPTGMPIEVYCFSAIQEWTGYEGVQSDLFDHIMAVAPLFGLRIFQYNSNFLNSEIMSK